MKSGIAVLSLLMISTCLPGIDVVFKEKWEHPDEIPGRVQFSTIDKDGDVVATFFIVGQKLITPKKVITIAPFGQGPDEVENVFSICPYRDGKLAFIENPGKMKIFKKVDDNYRMEKIIWLKRSPYSHYIHNALFYDGRWFLGGYEVLNRGKNGEDVSYVKVHDEEGQLIKNLAKKNFSTEIILKKNISGLRRYILNYRDKIFYLIENEFKVAVINGKTLTEEKDVHLSRPDFYKEMPNDFFENYKMDDSMLERKKKMGKWLTSYSRITKAIVEKDYLIIQARTCNPNLKKFALLFYRADTFKYVKIFFIDDLLLGSKDGKLYFFGKGDPGLDEEAVNQTTINIYEIK